MSTAPLRFAWLEVTGRCNESCGHCYADSGPQGTHGTMTVPDWERTIRQLAELGARDVQFIGGEPTLYPYIGRLITYAHERGLAVEMFSNLVAVRDELWGTIRDCGVKLATSYYSDRAADHDRVTRLPGSHRRTRANIEKALRLGVPVRGGVVAVRPEQRVHQAAADLTDLGVGTVGGDRTRAFGRGSNGAAPTVADLCGHCAHEKVAIGPDGGVWPCVLGRFLVAGNVRRTALADIWTGPRMAEIGREIRDAHGDGVESCTPPQFLPMCGPCGPCVPSVGHCDPQVADSIASPG